jgi:hypothetical protein
MLPEKVLQRLQVDIKLTCTSLCKRPRELRILHPVRFASLSNDRTNVHGRQHR